MNAALRLPIKGAKMTEAEMVVMGADNDSLVL
jgi:hypothetical protein